MQFFLFYLQSHNKKKMQEDFEKLCQTIQDLEWKDDWSVLDGVDLGMDQPFWKGILAHNHDENYVVLLDAACEPFKEPLSFQEFCIDNVITIHCVVETPEAAIDTLKKLFSTKLPDFVFNCYHLGNDTRTQIQKSLQKDCNARMQRDLMDADDPADQTGMFQAHTSAGAYIVLTKKYDCTKP